MLFASLLACLSLTRAHASLAASKQRPFLPTSLDDDANSNSGRMTFQLRQVHALHPETYASVFRDVHHSQSSFSSEPLSIRTSRTSVHRPRSQDAFHAARVRSMRYGQNMRVDWDEEEVNSPDVTDKDTLLTLAKMTFDAYIDPTDSTWYDLGGEWNAVRLFIFHANIVNNIMKYHECIFRAIRSAGSLTKMAFEVTSLRTRTIVPSYCPSKGPLLALLAVGVPRRKRIN